MLHTEFTPGQRRSERQLVHVVWMTSGLGCDGDTVALTAATSPSLEDLLTGAIPGMPGVVIYNPMLAFETGEELMRAWYDAERGRLDPFVLVLEGSVPNEQINGDGHWAGFGVDRDDRPADHDVLVDRPAGAQGGRRDGDRHLRRVRRRSRRCATTRPAPWACATTSAPSWTSRLGIPIVNLPGCPVAARQHHRDAARPRAAARRAGADDRPRRPGPAALAVRPHRPRDAATGPASPRRAAFADTLGDDERCLVKLGCKGPVVKCNVPTRGWVNGIGGCPNVGGICIGCTTPGFPDRFMPFMDPDRLGLAAARGARFTYGPVLRYFRDRRMRTHVRTRAGVAAPGDRAADGPRAPLVTAPCPSA